MNKDTFYYHLRRFILENEINFIKGNDYSQTIPLDIVLFTLDEFINGNTTTFNDYYELISWEKYLWSFIDPYRGSEKELDYIESLFKGAVNLKLESIFTEKEINRCLLRIKEIRNNITLIKWNEARRLLNMSRKIDIQTKNTLYGNIKIKYFKSKRLYQIRNENFNKIGRFSELALELRDILIYPINKDLNTDLDENII